MQGESRKMKTFVKQAREAITAKDYARAINIAETGLADDDALEKENAQSYYMLLVFNALALHNLDRDAEAAEIYEKAAMANPSLPIAWQGLVSMYEDKSGSISKLIRPLENLIPIYKNMKEYKKHKDAIDKLIVAYKETKNFEKAKELYEWFLSEESKEFYSSSEQPIELCEKSLLMDYIKCREDLDSDFVTKEIQKRRFRLGAGPVTVIKTQVELEIIKSSDIHSWYEKALELLDEGSEKVALMLKAAKNAAIRRQFMSTVEEKKKAMDKIFALVDSIFDEELSEVILDCSDIPYSSGLLQKYSEIPEARFANEVKYQLGNQKIQPKLDKNSLFSTWTYISMCWDQQKYGDLLTTLPVLKQLISSAEQNFGSCLSKMKTTMKRYEFLALVHCEKYEAASKIMDQFEESDDCSIFEAKLAIMEASGKITESINLLTSAVEREPTSVKNLIRLGWQHFRVKNFSQASKYLGQAETNSPDSCDIFYRLGRVAWETGESGLALNYWLRSVKSDPNHAESFLYLGHYYLKMGDKLRSEKCFSKALKLDADLVPAAVQIARIWIEHVWKVSSQHGKTGKEVVDLLEPYTAENLRNWQLWKYFGIGLSWIDNRSKASFAFQNALKADQADELECLLLLAEAYKKDKKLSAATRAYCRAVEVKPDCILARIGLGSVKIETREYAESIEVFSALLLENIPSNIVDSAKGLLAKAHALNAKALIAESKFDEALEQVNAASTILVALVRSCPKMFLAWKTLAELCEIIFVFRLSDRYEEYLQAVELAFNRVDEKEPIMDEICQIVQEKALLFSAKALFECSKLITNSAVLSDLWLGIAQSVFRYSILHASHVDTTLQLIESCVMQALRHNSSNGEAWNIYGLVAMEQGRYPLAQHSFITSLESFAVEPGHVWINLALLYHRLGDVELCLQAIERAQMSDVDNPLCWYANAQVVGSEEKKSELIAEAVKCPRASTLLNINSAYVQKTWPKLVASASEDEKRKLTEELELCLSRLTALSPADGQYTNLYGILKERSGSKEGLEAALKLFKLSNESAARQESLRNLFRASITCRQKMTIPSGATEMFSKFLDACQHSVDGDSALLDEFTSAEICSTDPCLWEAAIWERCRLACLKGQDIMQLTTAYMAIDSESTAVLLFRMVACEDSDEAEAILLQLLDLVTAEDSSKPPVCESIIWILTHYLMSKGCYIEAVSLRMTLLERTIFNPSSWISLATMLDEVRKIAEESVITEVISAVKEWLDEQVPQLDRKPRLEEMEAYQLLLFPASDILPISPQ